MILILYNPAAGVRWARRKALQRRLASVPHRWVDVAADGSHWQGMHPQEFERVIVIGGDGTVHQTVQWLMQHNATTPLGIVPTGSANLLARTLGVPLGFGLAVQLALHGSPQPIDLGVVNGQYYFVAAMGVGYDAWAVENTSRAWKALFGRWAYVRSLVSGIFHFHESAFRVTLDGAERTARAKTIFIMNAGRFFGLDFGPGVRFDDGQVNVAIVRPLRLVDYPLMLARLIGRRHAWEGRLEYTAVTTARLEYARRLPIQLDGEVYQLPSPLSVSVARGRLAVVASVPKKV